MRALLAALLALLALAAAAPAALAATTLPDVEDEVMCTTCGVPLNIAESPQADRQRAFIRERVDEGLSKDEVKAALVEEYGTQVLAMPRGDEGVGAAAYLVPAGLGLGGIALLAVLLPRWRRRADTAGPPGGDGAPAPATDAELARLDRELAARP